MILNLLAILILAKSLSSKKYLVEVGEGAAENGSDYSAVPQFEIGKGETWLSVNTNLSIPLSVVSDSGRGLMMRRRSLYRGKLYVGLTMVLSCKVLLSTPLLLTGSECFSRGDPSRAASSGRDHSTIKQSTINREHKVQLNDSRLTPGLPRERSTRSPRTPDSSTEGWRA